MGRQNLPKLPKSMLAIWITSLLLGLAIFAGALYVVIHFVLKFW